jgi:hypothetical protein
MEEISGLSQQIGLALFNVYAVVTGDGILIIH